MNGPGSLTLLSPLSGWAMPLEDVPDPVFAGRMLGDGVAIDPTEGVLYAPCDGQVASIAPTAHALTLVTDIGAELLVHVGIDTVALKGEGFEALVPAGRRVRAGEPVLRFDLDLVARRAASLITPLLVTNTSHFDIARRLSGQAVETGMFLLELRELRTAGAHLPTRADDVVHRRRLRVSLPHGIHARPAGQVVQALRGFDAQVTLHAHGRRASAASAVALMTLGVRRDDEVTLEASGPGAASAIEALATLLGGASLAPAPPAAPSLSARLASAAGVATSPAAGTELPGVVAAPGLAIGTATFVRRFERSVVEDGAGVAQESAALARAHGQVRAHLSGLVAREQGPRAEVIAAHLEFIDDPMLHASAAAAIERGASAGHAWRSAIRASIDTLRELGDARLLERVDDLLDLESQVLAALAGDEAPAIVLPEAAVVLADELLPSQLVALDTSRLAGIATSRGGPTSHVALLAAAMGKPMLVGLGPSVLAIGAGTPLLLDAERGLLWVDPPGAELGAARRTLEEQRELAVADRAASHAPAVTADGTHVAVLANIGTAAEAAGAVSQGAEGCGLLRSEFLFLERRFPPTADEQAREYQRVLDDFAGRPVVVRTLDAGADKPIAYLALPHEDNPALGVRGIRTSLIHPQLLAAQLEALLRVRPLAGLRVMLPMVNDPAEVERVRALMHAAGERLGIDGCPQLGVMIETPAAALGAAQLCAVADFLSIGTNDLTQYTLAMDRTHPELAASLDGLHPAVLRLIAATTAAAAASNRPVAVCGGLASDPLAVPVLLGLGVHELSVVPRLVPQLKAQVRGLELAGCRVLAARALVLSSAAEVRQMLREAACSDPRSALKVSR